MEHELEVLADHHHHISSCLIRLTYHLTTISLDLGLTWGWLFALDLSLWRCQQPTPHAGPEDRQDTCS
jgi:hypothetical protein